VNFARGEDGYVLYLVPVHIPQQHGINATGSDRGGVALRGVGGAQCLWTGTAKSASAPQDERRGITDGKRSIRNGQAVVKARSGNISRNGNLVLRAGGSAVQPSLQDA
jgi:hypothetical protein